MVYIIRGFLMAMAGKIIQGRVINEATGETMNLALYQPKTTHPYRHGGFVQMSQEALMQLAQSDLTGDDMKVLFALLARLDFENYLQAPQAEIAEQIGMRQPHVARAIKHLCEHGVIIMGAKVGRSNTYRLCPSFGFKGKSKNYGKMMADISKFAQEAAQRDPDTIDLIDGTTDRERAA